MISYKDKTFCSASRTTCFNDSCYRFLSKAEENRAQGLELPVSYADFWDGCKEIASNGN